jgi:hypothetical protein
MKKEPFTVILKIVDEEAFKEIWKFFRDDRPLHGARITAAGWGHAFDERDKYKAVAEAAFKDGKSFGLVFDELPETIVVDDKCFHHVGHGVFSTTQVPNQFQGEWYPHYDDLRKAYPKLPEDPYGLP